jgi:hypothetical protein
MYYDLCFGKRPKVELYDCINDPDQIQNLAGDPRKQGLIKGLHEQMVAYLQKSEDPRFNEKAVRFEQFLYRGK